MVKRGLTALFFVMGLVILTGSVWFFHPRPEKPQPVPSLWIFYARATGLTETLYARHYSSRGQALGQAILVGRLGLVQEYQGATAAVGGWEWVTTGSQAVGLHGGKVAARRPAPKGQQIVSLRSFSHHLDAVMETVQTHRVTVDRWSSHQWKPLTNALPVGITTLVSGPEKSVWAMIAQPDQAWLEEVAGGHRVYKTPRIEPQGTVAFWRGHPVIPYARGTHTFGFWDGSRHPFPSVRQAAVSVTDTRPVWGVGVSGMIPFSQGHFHPQDTVQWPQREPTTPEVLGNDRTPWVVVMSGFSQGNWFNVETGRFGPAFHIKTPWWAVVRAASLGS